MNKIPIYLKTVEEMPRPTDPEYYLVTANGVFLGRNHPFFSSETLARRPPRSLMRHSPSCDVRYPKLGVAALEYIVGFFHAVYEEHGAESIVLLYWDQGRRRYTICVPKQTASVWESYSGIRSALDVTYEVPLAMPRDHLLVADIHCHCDFGAFVSLTDEQDELFRDGVHAIVGLIEREPPQVHLELAIDGSRFKMRFHQFFKGYQRRRRRIPQQWLDQVTVDVKRPRSSFTDERSATGEWYDKRSWHSEA